MPFSRSRCFALVLAPFPGSGRRSRGEDRPGGRPGVSACRARGRARPEPLGDAVRATTARRIGVLGFLLAAGSVLAACAAPPDRETALRALVHREAGTWVRPGAGPAPRPCHLAPAAPPAAAPAAARLAPRAGWSAPAASPQATWERRAPRRAAPDDAARPEGEAAPRYEVAVGGLAYIWDEFSLARLHNERWDRSSRVEVAVRYHPAPGPRFDPVVGVYGFYEKREWDDGGADLDYRSYGLGAELGMGIAPQGWPREGHRALRLAYFPYARLGVAGQSGDFENVPQGTDVFVSGDFDALRGEAQVGFDLQLLAGSFAALSAGVGGDIWGSLPYDAVTRDGAGQALDDSDDLWAWGWGVFARVVLSLRF